MICITNRDNQVVITGHAAYAKRGEDIVCAAVSALTHTFVEGMETLTSDGIECDDQTSMVRLIYKDLSPEGNLLLESFFIGLESIVEEYPDYLNLCLTARPGVDGVKS